MDIDDRTRRRGSDVLHRVDEFAARPMVAMIVLAMDGIWLLSSVAFGFPSRLESIFQTIVAALTLASVFILQHTQARQESVTQRKLDELLRALPGADNSLIVLEEGSDPELRSAHDRQRQLRQDAVTPD